MSNLVVADWLPFLCHLTTVPDPLNKYQTKKLQNVFISFQYIYLLLIIFLLEATVGGLAYLYENQITDELKQTLNTTFLEYYAIDEDKTVAIDRMQQEVILIRLLNAIGK